VENKWNLERQSLEEEIETLRREIAVVGNAQRRLFWQEEESGKCKIYILYFYLNFSLFLESPEPENPVAAQLNIFFYCDMREGSKSHSTKIQNKKTGLLMT